MHTTKDLDDFRNLYGLSVEDISTYLDISKPKLQKIISSEEALPKMMAISLKSYARDLKELRFDSTIGDEHRFTFIDLFAGIGGMRIGFEKAGGKCVFTSEWDKYPAKMYEDNFGDKPAGDITRINVKDIPRHDILVGGFPCQPFSLAGVSKKNSMGRSHGFEDKTQGTLFFDVARIIAFHRPKMFLLENVKNLRSHDGGNTFKIIMETLREELGYTVTEKLIDGGLLVPQHRERVYIVGTLSDTPFEFPEIKAVNRCLDDILEPYSKKNDTKYTLSDGLWNSLKNHSAKHKAKGNGFGFGLNKRSGRARTLSARYYKDGAEILIEQKNRNPRRLSPRECARLMGFPEKFKITLSDMRSYKCFGNSVVVPIIQKLAIAMSKSQVFESSNDAGKRASQNENNLMLN